MFYNNSSIKGKLKLEIKTFLELSDHHSNVHYNLYAAAEVVLYGNLITLNTHSRKN